ncbi:AAA family ATPase [Chlamydiota bacterium]
MTEKNDEKQKPNFEDIQKDLAKLFSDKYGFKDVKMNFPEPDHTKEDKNEPTEEKKYNLSFDYKPKEVKAYLDRFVIKQDDAKKVLSVAVCDHYNHVKKCIGSTGCGHYTKQNVLLIGPTGVGKTYLIKTIADLIGVPFVKADATKFSETGYVGADVDDLVRELLQKADNDIRLAEYGIIYVDEVDKIAAPPQLVGRDVSGQGVQRGLLKLMEETEVPVKSPLDMVAQMQSLIR